MNNENKSMTTFARFYENRVLVEISNEDMEALLDNDQNKILISNYIYQRLYCRFLKIFDYKNFSTKIYVKQGKNIECNIFDEEYKNGFIQMASCSLLIETIGGFLNGVNETRYKDAERTFNKVFEYAKSKDNKLSYFLNTKFYDKIRCGLLHQGQTKDKFIITRKGDNIFNENTINAYLFHKELKKLLNEYKLELQSSDWNSEIWIKCRTKIEFIVKE